MQKKRNITLIISLVILTGLTLAVSWLNLRNDTDAADKTIFRVSGLDKVDRVLLETKSGRTELNFNGVKWKINNRYDADRHLIDVLFATLEQAQPKRPVASSRKDSLANALEQNGTKVSLFTGNEEKFSFFAGGNTTKTQAYFKREDDDTPYVMVIPGYRVYTSGIFELAGNGWRDKRIFNFNWRNFKSLSASFPNDPSQNFTVTFLDEYFGIEGLPGMVDTTRLNNYLDAVSLLTADSFIQQGYDSLIQTTAQVTIDVSDIANRHYRLDVYPLLTGHTSVPGKIDSAQFVLFNRKKMIEISRKKSWFIKRG